MNIINDRLNVGLDDDILKEINEKVYNLYPKNPEKWYEVTTNFINCYNKYKNNYWWNSNDLKKIAYYQTNELCSQTSTLMVDMETYVCSLRTLLEKNILEEDIFMNMKSILNNVNISWEKELKSRNRNKIKEIRKNNQFIQIFKLNSKVYQFVVINSSDREL